MKSKTLQFGSSSTCLDIIPRIMRMRFAGLVTRMGVVVVFVALLAGSVYWTTAASNSKKQSHKQQSTVAWQKAKTAPIAGKLAGRNSLTLGSYIPRFMLPQGPPPPGSPYPIAIYEGTCTTPQNVFNLQDTDRTVCAKVTGAPTGFRLIWSNANDVVVQDVPVGAGQSTFTLTGSSSLGDWRVIAFEPFGGAVYTVQPFTVLDSGNPEADLTISKSILSDSVSSGGQITYSIQVENLGPSDAASVQVTDSLPANTSFSSFDPISGASFNCANVGGDVTCTIANLARGQSAIFLASYDVSVSTGTTISNPATISSTTPDPNSLNNSSTADMTVTSPTIEQCELTCPADIVVTANTTDGGQPGAFVTYGAASGNGNCGAISNTPASGSFFTVGVHPVSSNSELGGAGCTFTVTVLDTNPPSITCPADVTVNLASGETEATLTEAQIGTPSINASGGGTLTFVRSDDVAATFDSNGNVVTPAVVHSLTDPYEIGTTGIRWTVTDAGGRTATCSQRIIVNGHCDSDTQTPTITAPADITVSTGPDNTGCTAVLEELGDPTAHDDCSVVVTASGIPSGNPFPVGQTTGTYTATDPSGHTASDTQLVTVIDNTPPIIVAPPNATYVCPSEVPAADPSQAHGDNPNLPNGGPPTDNCGTPTVTVGQTSSGAGSVANPLIITRTFTATDSHGNSASAVQTITVADGIPPTITLNGANPQYVECHTSYPELGATAHDNCSADFAATPSGTVNVNTPGTYTVTYNANDAAGNAATPVTRTVIVQDTIAPTITLNGQAHSMWPPNHKYQTFTVANFVASADDGCDTTIDLGDVVIEKVTSDEIENGNGDGNTINDIVISADCKSVQLRSEREGDGNGRVYTITFRVRDASGNTTRATATVVVQHNPGETAVDSGVHYTVNSSCQ